MKLIQAMKQIKDLQKKADDLRAKISLNSAHMSFETPTYGDKQRDQVREWVQSCLDISKEVLRLRVAIQKTNIVTFVKIELGGKAIEKSIAEWIHRRRDLAELDRLTWAKLTDKGLKEGIVTNTMQQQIEAKRILNFDPAERDTNVELYRSEPSIIDATLETVNAVTDLIEN